MTQLPTRKAGKAAGGWSPSWIKPTLNSSSLVLHRCWYKTQEFKKSIWRQFITTLSTPQSQWVLNFTIRQTVCQIPLLCLVPNTEYLLSLLLKSSQMWALSVFVIKYSLSLFSTHFSNIKATCSSVAHYYSCKLVIFAEANRALQQYLCHPSWVQPEWWPIAILSETNQ